MAKKPNLPPVYTPSEIEGMEYDAKELEKRAKALGKHPAKASLLKKAQILRKEAQSQVVKNVKSGKYK